MGSKKQDNRMGWIRNLEALNQSESDSSWREFEIASECYIPGEFVYDNGKISCRYLTIKKDKNGLWQYLLRMEYSKKDFLPNDQGTNKGYYFINGPVGEIAALLSLFFQCRFYILASYTFLSENEKIKDEEVFLYRRCDKEIHPTIFDNEKMGRNFGIGLNEFLEKVKKLPPKKHQSFILASWRYAESLKEASFDNSEMVFIHLVSAIEALSKQYPLSKEQNPLDGESFEDLFAKANLSQHHLKQLREILHVDENGKIDIIEKSALKFREFIKAYSEELCFSHKEDGAAEHIYVTPANFDRTLKSIYDARSKYLHEGEPMYLSRFMNGGIPWDFDASLGRRIDNRTYKFDKKLPYPHWFENLVRHCLLKYLEQNIEETSKN